MTIDRVLAAWRASDSLHRWRPTATVEEVAAVEDRLERSLPDSLRAIFVATDGGEFMRGNLKIEPLHGERDFNGLDRLTEDIRGAAGTIAEELLVFGGNGSDLLFALWLPRAAESRPDAPVVALPVGDEPMALAGTSLSAFATGWSAYYLALLEAPRAAFDALRVPPAADIPWFPDPYEKPISADELREAFST